MIWNGAWRVNGNLSVSRAIGDAPDKKFVIGEGDVMTTDLDGTEDYLLVACDGVWDVLSGEEIVECVSKHLASPTGSRQSVAKALIQHARAEGSGDNMTVIVSFFSSFSEDLTTGALSVDTPPTKTEESLVDTPPSETKDCSLEPSSVSMDTHPTKTEDSLVDTPTTKTGESLVDTPTTKTEVDTPLTDPTTGESP